MRVFGNGCHLVIQFWHHSKKGTKRVDSQLQALFLTTQLWWVPNALYNVCISTGLFDRQRTLYLRILRQWWREDFKGLGDLVSWHSSSLVHMNAITASPESNRHSGFRSINSFVVAEFFAAQNMEVKYQVYFDAERVCRCVELPQRVLRKSGGRFSSLEKRWKSRLCWCTTRFQKKGQCSLAMLEISGGKIITAGKKNMTDQTRTKRFHGICQPKIYNLTMWKSMMTGCGQERGELPWMSGSRASVSIKPVQRLPGSVNSS